MCCLLFQYITVTFITINRDTNETSTTYNIALICTFLYVETNILL